MLEKPSLVLGVLGFLGTLAGFYYQWWSGVQLEKAKLESTLLVDAMRNPDEEARRATLTFLLKSRLVQNENLQKFLDSGVDVPKFPPAPGAFVGVTKDNPISESVRVARNSKNLGQTYPAFRRKVEEVIKDLEAMGVRPFLLAAYRKPEDQLAMFKAGATTLKYGLHNVTSATGVPEALAVDIVDGDSPLTPRSHQFLLALAYIARRHGLQTGISWGLPAYLQVPLEAALEKGDFNADVRLGWDPSHVEARGISAAEAKAGKRPEG